MRPCQILRSPGPDSGGGPPGDDVVTISKAELDELRARAAGASDPPGPGGDHAEASRSREVAHARELDARDRKAGELERAYKAALRDRELATALVGRPLVPGAAAQLIKLWRDDFEVVDEDGSIRILAKDGRSVDQAVLDRLAGPDFAHFCLPSSRGGTGARGQNRSAAPGAAPAGPRTLGEAVVMQWREAQARPPGGPASTGWGRRGG